MTQIGMAAPTITEILQAADAYPAIRAPHASTDLCQSQSAGGCASLSEV